MLAAAGSGLRPGMDHAVRRHRLRLRLHLADRLEGFEDDDVKPYAAALAANLALNASWSWVFFRSRNLPLATGVAAALAASSADLVRRVWKSRTQRGVVLAPYAAWTGFAAALTAELLRRNPRR